MAQNQIIIQIPVTESTDFDVLLHIEETLFKAFPKSDFAVVEGHEFGDGRFNIFIDPKSAWEPVVEHAKAALELRGVLGEALIATRAAPGGRPVVVWPEGHAGDFRL